MRDERRSAVRALPTVLLMLVALAAPAAPADRRAYLVAQTLVALPGGRRLNVYCSGSGSPAIVLEAGLGATTVAWAPIQPTLARTNRVCSYDRAGMGFSDPGPLPRDAAADAEDLHVLIGAAHLPVPVVLVAHSYGGMIARLETTRHPHEVAALVLVDPTDEDLLSIERIYPGIVKRVAADITEQWRCARAAHLGELVLVEARLHRCKPDYDDEGPQLDAVIEAQWMKAAQRDAFASENENLFGTSASEVRSERRSLGALPLNVLTRSAGDSYPNQTPAQAAALRAARRRFHRRQASLSSRGIERVVAETSHEIQRDRPDAVIGAVREVLRRCKPGPGLTPERSRPDRHSTPGAS